VGMENAGWWRGLGAYSHAGWRSNPHLRVCQGASSAPTLPSKRQAATQGPTWVPSQIVIAKPSPGQPRGGFFTICHSLDLVRVPPVCSCLHPGL
jgi:hypothetical protein